jgi:hypothetical protein
LKAKPLISSITPDSLKQWPDASVAVVAHDAGAARLLFSWLKSCKRQLLVYAEGPALKILDQELPGTGLAHDLRTCLSNAQLLISGTGWSSDLEHQARVLAAAQELPSIAVVDHWVNYQERFERDGNCVLPQSLWVSDKEAAEVAQNAFPALPIQQLPNLWLNQLVEDVKRCRSRNHRTKTHHQGSDLLYLLEPLRDRQSGAPTGHEFMALDFWLAQLPDLIAKGLVHQDRNALRLRLRPHPSETPGKYDAWIAKHSDAWPLQLDPHPSLPESLAYADLAFGCETQALVAAIACDINAISTLPPTEPPCRLPHRKLQHLTRLSRP